MSNYLIIAGFIIAAIGGIVGKLSGGPTYVMIATCLFALGNIILILGVPR